MPRNFANRTSSIVVNTDTIVLALFRDPTNISDKLWFVNPT